MLPYRQIPRFARSVGPWSEDAGVVVDGCSVVCGVVWCNDTAVRLPLAILLVFNLPSRLEIPLISMNNFIPWYLVPLGILSLYIYYEVYVYCNAIAFIVPFKSIMLDDFSPFEVLGIYILVCYNIMN